MEHKFYVLGAIFIIGLLVIAGLPKQAVVQADALKKFTSYDELKDFVKNNTENYFGPDYRSAAPLAASESSKGTPSLSSPTDYSTTNIQVAGVDEADIVKTDGKYIYAVSGNRVIILDAYPAASAKIISEIQLNNSSPREIFVSGESLTVFADENYPYPILKEGGALIAPDIYPYRQSSIILLYDISDRSNPKLAKNFSADGYYFTSRMVGSHVYAVINQPVFYGNDIPLPLVRSQGVASTAFPEIYYFDIPDRSYNFVNIIAIDVQTGELASKAFVLPSSQNVYVSKDNIYLTYTKWLDYADFFDRLVDEVILLSVPQLQGRINEIRSYNLSRNARYIEIEQAVNDYVSGLTREQMAALEKSMQEKMTDFQQKIAKEQERTVIHKISIRGGQITYESQGSVPGHVLNQFSMDEHDSYFRVATTSGSGFFGGPVIMGVAAREVSDIQVSGSAPSEPVQTAPALPQQTAAPSQVIAPPPPRSSLVNNLYVLDRSLNVAGKVEDLAPGERIYSARFLGNRAYLVTFRQVDPLFVVDLSNPNLPAVLGQLKVTGVSDYLHPIDDNHIIGIGRDATEQGFFKGLKIALFDVSDVSQPKEISKIILGDRGTDSQALYDHKAFLYSPSKKLLVIPVLLAEIDRSKPQDQWSYGEYKWQGAYVFTADAVGFELLGKISHATNETSEYETYYGQFAVKRSLYIGDMLYTISDRLVKANQLPGLEEISMVKLPGWKDAQIIY